MRIKEEIKYMMRKSIFLILSEFHTKRIYDAIIHFKPVSTGNKEDLPHFEFKKLSMFLNLWMGISSFKNNLLFEIAVPYSWDTSWEVVEEESINGKVDWRKTLELWTVNQSGFMIKKRKKAPSQNHRQFVRFVLEEILVHIEVIQGIFSPYLESGLNEVYEEIVEDINFVEKYLRTHELLSSHDGNREKKRIKDELLKIIEQDDLFGPSTYKDYRSRINPKSPRGFFSNDFVQKLEFWREQYLDCRIWLSEEIGLRLNHRSSKEKLFEFFAFMEFSSTMARCGVGSTRQRSFISPKSSKTEFRIGKNYFVSLDTRSNRFIETPISEVWEGKAIGLTPSFKGIHPDWFINNIENYEDGIVLRVRNGRWVPREGLLLLGHMINYAVNNGIIVVKYKTSAEEIGGHQVSENLVRLTVPLFPNKTIWVMRLRPRKRYEDSNKEIMEMLVSLLFKDEL